MLPQSQIEKALERFPPDFLDIVLELRNLIASIAPDAAETAHWKGFSYYHPGRGGPVSAGICQITILPDHIQLGFIHGTFLADPLHLLEGERSYKRFIRITSFDTAPWEDLRKLIALSSAFDPRSIKSK